MKKNNQGFMLAEVIVVGTSLVVILTTMYIAFNRVYSAYNERSHYYSTDGLYAASAFENLYIDKLLMNSIINSESMTGNNFIDLSNCDDPIYSGNEQTCRIIKSTYKIDKVFFTTYNILSFATTETGIDSSIKEYIKYMVNSDEQLERKDNQGNTIDYKYRIIVRTEDNNYASLKIR